MQLTDEIRRTLKLAAPIMGAYFLQLVMVFVDNLMVGRLGAEHLAGLALASAFYNLVFVIVIGILGALSALVSEHTGAGRDAKAGHATRQGLILGGILSLVAAIALGIAGPIFEWMGQPETPSQFATEYLRAMILTVPAQCAFVAMRSFTEGTDDAPPSAVIAAGAALLNIPLDYVLIFGAFGIPALGVAGAGYATAILSWLSLVAIVVYVKRRRRYESFELFKKPSIDLTVIREILEIGIPLGGAVAMEMSFFVVTTFLMGLLGALELAAHQVALNAASMVFMLPLGLSFAVSIRIGTCVGRADAQGAHTAWKASLVITGVMQSTTALIFLLVPERIVDLYDQHDDVKDLAIQMLRIAGFFQLFDGFQVVGMGALRGLKDTRFALVATFFSFWCIGIGVVLWQYWAGNPKGLWAGLLVGLGVASIAHHTRARRTIARMGSGLSEL